MIDPSHELNFSKAWSATVSFIFFNKRQAFSPSSIQRENPQLEKVFYKKIKKKWKHIVPLSSIPVALRLVIEY